MSPLKDYLKTIANYQIQGDENQKVTQIHFDSRKVVPHPKGGVVYIAQQELKPMDTSLSPQLSKWSQYHCL